jgi:Trk-type K+ transport system membrane component
MLHTNSAKAVVSALVSGVIAFLSALLTALQGETAGFGTIMAGQWVTAALAFFVGLGVTGGATYKVRNHSASPGGLRGQPAS